MRFLLSVTAIILTLSGCATQSKNASDGASQYQRFRLSNGLDVVLATDHSDPIVAVAVVYRVGSNRETEFKTGFAHLFEHLLFQSTMHIPAGQMMKMLNEAGADFNGGTTADLTIYHEVAPKTSIDRLLWMESSRMGFFIDAIDQSTVANEIPVVQNERRQRLDTQPYGRLDEITRKYLYPAGHPYSWPVIGSMSDLSSATITDAKNFYTKYYGPENASLVIVGDFDTKEMQQKVSRFFGTIKPGGNPPELPKQPHTLSSTTFVSYPDQKAKSVLLTIQFPSSFSGAADEPATELLTNLLGDGKRSILFRHLVAEKQVATNVSSTLQSELLSGNIVIRVVGREGVSSDILYQETIAALARFKTEGVSSQDIKRQASSYRTTAFQGLTSVMDRAQQYAYSIRYYNDPLYVQNQPNLISKVQPNEIITSYEKYLSQKPHLAVAFYPASRNELAFAKGIQETSLTESTVAASAATTATTQPAQTKPSNEDLLQSPEGWRYAVPKVGEPEPPTALTVLRTQIHGVPLSHSTYNEVPLTYFTMTFDGGALFADPNKGGVVAIANQMFSEGTLSLDAQQWQEALETLGAKLSISLMSRQSAVSFTVPNENFNALIQLLKTWFQMPRFLQENFSRIKQVVKTQQTQAFSSPNQLVNVGLNALLYGPSTPEGTPVFGWSKSLDSITLADVAALHKRAFSRANMSMSVVTALSVDQIRSSLTDMLPAIPAGDSVSITKTQPKLTGSTDTVYIIDVPSAPQSSIRLVKRFPKLLSPELPKLDLLNYDLGDGTSGKFFQVLREEKGYTYGAYGVPRSNNDFGLYLVSTNVATPYTGDSLHLIHSILNSKPADITEQILKESNLAITRVSALSNEQPESKLAKLVAEQTDHVPLDYENVAKAIRDKLTLDESRELAKEYFADNQALTLIVGDYSVISPQLRSNGFHVILINPDTTHATSN